MKNNANKQAIERIRQHLDGIASKDEVFAAKYAREGKNLDECFKYILSEARKRGTAVCMDDEEVFGMAVHYYDEDDIKAPANVPGAKTSVSIDAERSKVETVVAEAVKQVNEETSETTAKKPVKAKKKPVKERHEPYVQLSLFD